MPDTQDQAAERGELRSALAAGEVSSDQQFADLGAIAAGKAPGRPNAEAITIADLTGTGVQDTAIATFAHHKASVQNIGAGLVDLIT